MVPFRGAAVVLSSLALAACGGAYLEGELQISRELGGGEDELRVCAGASGVEGIDVSVWQGSIDWRAVRAAGKRFAFARVSDGLRHPDSRFRANWAGMRAAGVVRGAYQFFRPAQDARAQANLFLQHVPRLEAGDLPPVIDVEVADGVAGARIVAGVRTWLDHVESKLGRRPLVYTSIGFWGRLPGTSDFRREANLWVANWGVRCPSVPSPWNGFHFWQYTDRGHVRGISGHVDLDRFNGSLAELFSLAGGRPPNATAYDRERADQLSREAPIEPGGAVMGMPELADEAER